MGNIELNIKSIVSREVIFCVFFSIQIILYIYIFVIRSQQSINIYLCVSYEKIAWFNIQPLYERTT